MSLKFIHCADLHLGRSSSFYPFFKGDNDFTPELMSLKRIVALACERKVHFVLFCGDVFDSSSIPVPLLLGFSGQLRKLEEKGIDYFIAPGNHDPYLVWPDFLKERAQGRVFSPRGGSFTVKSKEEGWTCEILGAGHPDYRYGRSLTPFIRPGEGKVDFRVACLHGQIASNAEHEKYAPFTREELLSFPVDYWALGHVHKRMVVNERNPAIVYPGNIQGANFKESGEKGCYYGEWSPDSSLFLEFVPSAPLLFINSVVSLSQCKRLDEIGLKVSRAAEKERAFSSPGEKAVNLAFTGISELYQEIEEFVRQDGALEECETWLSRSDVKVVKLESRVRPVMDMEGLKEREDFAGELWRVLKNTLSDEKAWNDMMKELQESSLAFPLKKILREDFTEDGLKNIMERGGFKLLNDILQREEENDY